LDRGIEQGKDWLPGHCPRQSPVRPPGDVPDAESAFLPASINTQFRTHYSRHQLHCNLELCHLEPATMIADGPPCRSHPTTPPFILRPIRPCMDGPHPQRRRPGPALPRKHRGEALMGGRAHWEEAGVIGPRNRAGKRLVAGALPSSIPRATPWRCAGCRVGLSPGINQHSVPNSLLKASTALQFGALPSRARDHDC